ncbi:MAG: histidine kinase [Thiohalomonadales bacterium]
MMWVNTKFMENRLNIMPVKPPATGWQHKKRGLVSGDIFLPLLGISIVVITLLIGSFVVALFPAARAYIFTIEIGLVITAGFLFYTTQERINRNLLEPLSHLRNWALRMRSGNLSAQIPVPQKGEFAILAGDINSLGESLRALSREMDAEVKKQTERLAQKTRYLEILYEVASNSNTTSDMTDLLIRYLGTIQNILNASAATVRLVSNDRQMRLVGSIGVDSNFDDAEKTIPLERCICAQNYSKNILYCDESTNNCQCLLPKTLHKKYNIISIPLQYQKSTLGIYHCFISPEIDAPTEEQKNLLTNIAQHLSLAIEKDRLDDESRRMSIMQERTMLAHELHDSLAQTLASLRFQVSILNKTMADSNNQQALSEIEQIRGGLDEANNELRELLAHFRVPMDERGLVHATHSLIERFQNETGVSVFFQNECPDMQLPSIVEVQVLHIIQESLANIRKHAKAENVRIMIRNLETEHYYLLVEDDGVGIEMNYTDAKPGEHVGLSIMQERARRISGELSIDSDPGEGTRIELDFYSRNFDKTSQTHAGH